jgi:ATP/maltotriose-dependent transcriptional regulator MalT
VASRSFTKLDEVAVRSLSPAERRVLTLLPTYFSLREIGNRLYLSRNTVKTHSISIYNKLGVSARGPAVERARELGLLIEHSRSSRRVLCGHGRHQPPCQPTNRWVPAPH